MTTYPCLHSTWWMMTTYPCLHSTSYPCLHSTWSTHNKHRPTYNYIIWDLYVYAFQCILRNCILKMMTTYPCFFSYTWKHGYDEYTLKSIIRDCRLLVAKLRQKIKDIKMLWICLESCHMDYQRIIGSNVWLYQRMINSKRIFVSTQIDMWTYVTSSWIST